ncbi:MAG: glyoxalase [Acidobacteria bacterium]|nr:MAG: glyoxalase [Acidobacteriota bacterium]
MNRPAIQGLHHLALKVQNMQRMRAFYVDVLGFAVEWEPDPQNLYLSSGSDNLALHEVANLAPGGSLDHLGIIVPKPQDVDDWAAYLKSHGVSLKQEPKTHRDGARSVYLPDPEGNVIQIIYHPPISGK